MKSLTLYTLIEKWLAKAIGCLKRGDITTADIYIQCADDLHILFLEQTADKNNMGRNMRVFLSDLRMP